MTSPDTDHTDHSNLSPARLEAFSDGVLAIIITITAFELKAPVSTDIHSLLVLLPFFVTYAISFQMIGTYWNNHHHLLQVTKHVSGDIMWANLHLLFWLSLIPFSTSWLGVNYTATWPTVVYAAILLLSACAYTILQWTVVKHSDKKDEIVEDLKKSPKGLISLALYTLAVVFGFFHPFFSYLCIVLVAIMWFIPDRRLQKHI